MLSAGRNVSPRQINGLIQIQCVASNFDLLIVDRALTLDSCPSDLEFSRIGMIRENTFESYLLRHLEDEATFLFNLLRWNDVLSVFSI